MGYRKRYPTKRRSKNGYGAVVGDSVRLANTYGPKGTLAVGVLGFVFFYFFVPWALAAWAGASKSKMTGPYASIIGKFFDDIFIRRFINPAEWAGIAILVACVLLACWKTVFRKNVGREGERNVATVSKVASRLLD